MEKQSHRWEVFNFCNQNQLILMPPLSISKEKAQLCLDTLDAIFTEEAKAEA